MKKIKHVCKCLSLALLLLVSSVNLAFAENLKNNVVSESYSDFGFRYLTGTTFSIANDDAQTDKPYFLLSEIIFGRPLAQIEMGSKYQESMNVWNNGGTVSVPRFTILSNPALLESSYTEKTDGVNRLIFRAPQNQETVFKVYVTGFKPNSDFSFNFNIEEIAGGESGEYTLCINGETDKKQTVTINSKKAKKFALYSKKISTSNITIELKRTGGTGDNAIYAVSDLYIYGETEMFSISASEKSVGLGTPVTLTAFSALGVDLDAVKWEKNLNSVGFIPLADASGNQLIGATITDTPEAGQTCYRAMVMVDGTETYSNEVCVDAEYKCATNSAQHNLFIEDFGDLSNETDRDNGGYGGNVEYINTSIYKYVGDCKPLKAEGTYALMTNPKYAGYGFDGRGNSAEKDGIMLNPDACNNIETKELWFRDLYDHTRGGLSDGEWGAMLMVNAANLNGVSEQLVYSREVDMPCTNTNMIFSAWFANASTKTDVKISMKFVVKDANGNRIPSAELEVKDIDFNSGWIKGETSFNSGLNDKLTVEIYNCSTGGQGNDFMVDDISFSICVPEISLFASSTESEVQVKNDMVSGSCGSAINLDLEEGMAEIVFADPYYLWYVKEQGSNEFVHKAEYDNKTSIDTQITPYTQYYVVATANEAEAQEYIAGNLPKCTPVAISNTITVLCSPNLKVELKERNCNVITLQATKYDDPSNNVKFWWQISNDGNRWTNLNVPTNTEVINYTITSDSYFRINSEFTASPAVKVSLRGITLTSNPTKSYIGSDVKLTASTIKYGLGDDDKYQWFEKDLTSGTYSLLEETLNSFINYTLQSDKASVKVVAEGCEAEVTIEKLEPLEIKEKSRDCNEVTIEGITDLEPSKVKWYYSVDGNEYKQYSHIGTPITFEVSEEYVNGVYVKGKTTDGKESNIIKVYPIVIKNTIFNSYAVQLNPENGLMVNNEENIVIKTEISGIVLKAEDKINFKSCVGNILQSSASNEFTTAITEENKCFVTEYKGCTSNNIEFSIKPEEIVWPTAFNPLNQDGVNDTFMVGYGIKMQIYDRYGNLVSDSEDGWDGTIKGANAMPGVYYYVATPADGNDTLPDGQTIKKGTIELVHYVK